MKTSVLSLIVLAITFSDCQAQIGESRQADERVRRSLESSGVVYQVDSDGDFRIVDRFTDGRTQITFISSRTSFYGDLEIRQVWAIGYRATGDMPNYVARNLLSQNASVKLGGWELAKFNGSDAAVFSAKIAANADSRSLRLAISAVAITADEKEKELLGTDKL